MVARRGYVLDYHKVMAAHDYPVLRAADHLVSAAYLSQRCLNRGTKELLFILSLTVLRSEKEHIQSHIRVALQLGLTPQDILEAIEIALPEAGVVAFQHGFEHGARRLERRGWNHLRLPTAPLVATHRGHWTDQDPGRDDRQTVSRTRCRT